PGAAALAGVPSRAHRPVRRCANTPGAAASSIPDSLPDDPQPRRQRRHPPVRQLLQAEPSGRTAPLAGSPGAAQGAGGPGAHDRGSGAEARVGDPMSGVGARRPQVTIGLPVYNSERFLEETLRSLLGQTNVDFEVVVSDNGSTDATEAICRDYAATN